MGSTFYTPYLGTLLTGLFVYCLLTIALVHVYALITVNFYAFYHDKSQTYILDYTADEVLNADGHQNQCLIGNDDKPFYESSITTKNTKRTNIGNMGNLIGVHLTQLQFNETCMCSKNCFIEYTPSGVLRRGCDTLEDAVEPTWMSKIAFYRIIVNPTLRQIKPCGFRYGLDNYQDMKRLGYKIQRGSIGYFIKDLLTKCAIVILIIVVIFGMGLPIYFANEKSEKGSGVGRKISAYNLHRAKQSEEAEAENLANEVLKTRKISQQKRLYHKYTKGEMEAPQIDEETGEVVRARPKFQTRASMRKSNLEKRKLKEAADAGKKTEEVVLGTDEVNAKDILKTIRAGKKDRQTMRKTVLQSAGAEHTLSKVKHGNSISHQAKLRESEKKARLERESLQSQDKSRSKSTQ